MSREPRLFKHAVPRNLVGNPTMRRYMDEKGYWWALSKPHGRGTPCVFQAPDNSCLIHVTRPQICRDYPQDSFCEREEMEMSNATG